MSEAAAMMVQFWDHGRVKLRARTGALVPPIGALVRLGPIWRVDRVEVDYHQMIVDVHLLPASTAGVSRPSQATHVLGDVEAAHCRVIESGQ